MDRKKIRLRLRKISASLIITAILFCLLMLLGHLHRTGWITLPDLFLRISSNVSFVVAVLLIINLLLRLTLKRVYNWFDEPEEKIFYSKIYSWSIYTAGLLLILYHQQEGITIGNITLFVGLIATGLAFALRDVLLSFFSWLILLRKKPFRIGDYIRIGDDEGRVIHIGTFYVLLDKRPEMPDDFTRVPNRLFIEKSIINMGRTTLFEEIVINLNEMPSGKDKLTESLTEIVRQKNEKSISDTFSSFTDIRDGKLVLVVNYVVTFEARAAVRSSVIDAIYEILEKAPVNGRK